MDGIFFWSFYLIQARSDVAARSSGCTNKLDPGAADQITNKISREEERPTNQLSAETGEYRNNNHKNIITYHPEIADII